MKRLFCSLTFAGILCTNILIAQSSMADREKSFDQAEKIFTDVYNSKDAMVSYSKEGYASALRIYLELYKQDPANMNIAYKIGVCYLSSRTQRKQAIPYLEKAVTAASDHYKGDSFKEKNAPLIAWKFLGDAYHIDSQFDKAIDAYRKYIAVMAENRETDKDLLAEANRKIDMCTTAKLLVANPVKVKIRNLGAEVNSPYPDYSPVLSADQSTLFFTSRRPETTGGMQDDAGNYMEDIYMSEKTKTGWSKAKNIGPPVNTNEHEATVGLSPDAQTILIYKDDNGDGNIYSTTLYGDKWGKPVKLNDNINSKSWEPSACVSADGSTIYFVSDRPGGYGGRDIYMSTIDDKGEWGKAVNLGPAINTKYDEDAPFIHPDGVTLSFSSNGHSTMGGFDVFTSILAEDGTWAEPMNVGYPVNTPDDDVFYVVVPDSRVAYFTSFREGGLGEKDLYTAEFTDRKQTALTLVKGTVNDESGKPAQDVEITVTDNQTGKVIGIYHSNNKTGKFLFILKPGKNYNITYQAKNHLFYSENISIPKNSTYYELNRAIALNPIIVGSKIVLNNIFFDYDKSTLQSTSMVELKNLYLLLKSNPGMKVEISGYTDSKGTDAYNIKLSEDRARSVVDYLTEKGIGSDRMTARGLGKSKPIAPNQKEDGDDNPLGRQLNRRVELKITQVQ